MRSILGASVIQPIRFVEYSACEILWTQCEPAAMSGAVRRRLRLQTAMHLLSILIPGWRVELDPRTILPLVLVRSFKFEPVGSDSWASAVSEIRPDLRACFRVCFPFQIGHPKNFAFTMHSSRIRSRRVLEKNSPYVIPNPSHNGGAGPTRRRSEATLVHVRSNNFCRCPISSFRVDTCSTHCQQQLSYMRYLQLS